MNAADVDKYATLFTPSTPRASPLLGPTAIDNDPPPIPYVRQRADSDDFGAFVSVPSTADPLAAGFFGEDDHPTQLENKRHDCDTTAAQPSTLQFFDQVGRDARAATDLKRKSFLDELLLHQDDPMYFLEAQSQDPEQDVKQAATTEHDPADLDQNFFQPPPARAETITVNSSPKMPMKMPMLAPPLTSSPDIMTPDPLDDPESSSSPDHPSPPQRSSSYTSISALPSKWMNSLLRGQQLPTAKPSLESIFSDLVIPSGAPSLRKKSSSGILDFPELSGSHHARSSSHPPSAENQSRSPAAFASLPNPSQHYRPRQVQITHSTPFTPPNNIVGGGYVYIPPAGAPGFKGEDHDWDKGFSNELEKERLSEVENALGQPPIDTGRLNYTEQADREEERTKARISTPTMKPPGIEGVGAFIEKKVGGLELVGRKASTIPILNVELGLQVCGRPRYIVMLIKRDDNNRFGRTCLHYRAYPRPGSSSIPPTNTAALSTRSTPSVKPTRSLHHLRPWC